MPDPSLNALQKSLMRGLTYCFISTRYTRSPSFSCDAYCSNTVHETIFRQSHQVAVKPFAHLLQHKASTLFCSWTQLPAFS